MEPCVELKNEHWGDIAMVKVHRVWKGTLPAQFELYALREMEFPELRLGHRYVMAINRRRPPGFATLDLGVTGR